MSDQATEQSLSIEDRFMALEAPEDELQEDAGNEEQETAPQDNEAEEPEADSQDTPGEESEEQVEAEEEESEPDLVEIEVDGKSFKVPEVLKDKIMLQADYTRKTQEVAEQRKQVEHAQVQLQQAAQFQQQSLAEYAELLTIDKQLQEFAKVDWNALIDSDPVEAMRLSQARTDLKEARSNLTTQLNQKYEQQQYQQVEAQKKLLEEGYQVLTKEIPNWNTELARSLNHFAVEKFGFTKAEMDAVVDPRVVKVLHAAYQLQKQATSKPLTDKKVANLPKVSKPGSVSKQSVIQSRENDARKALKKTGSTDAAQAVFEARYSR
jgi:hypothetical protein